MIHVTGKAASIPEAKALKTWLNCDAAAIFQRYLLAKAAELTAVAGNLLVSGTLETQESQAIDARNKASEARDYIRANEIISECRASDYSFQTVDLTPKPLTTNQDEP